MSTRGWAKTPWLHTVLGGVAVVASVWLLGRAQSWLDPLSSVVLLYGLGEGAWALGAISNQRDYARNPRRPIINELRGLVGARGVVSRACHPRGEVRVDGELWQAHAKHRASVPKGTEVVVCGADSLVLEVEPVAAAQGDRLESVGAP